jgi:hypothetical protein
VCKKYDTEFDIIFSKCRSREKCVMPRQMIWAISKHLFKEMVTLSELGRLIGGKDHATVRYGIITINDLRSTNKRIEAIFNEILDEFNGLVSYEIIETEIKTELRDIKEMMKSQSAIINEILSRVS